jgi:hypothetical protein
MIQNDPRDRREVVLQAIEEAAESGLVEQVEEVSSLVESDEALNALLEAEAAARLRALGIED